MPTRMECNDVWLASHSRGPHCQCWHKRMTSLTMNQVPRPLLDYLKHFRGEIIVPLRRPSWYAYNLHTFNNFIVRLCRIGDMRLRSQQGNFYPILDQTPPNFMHMRLYSPHVREVTRCNHQNLHHSTSININFSRDSRLLFNMCIPPILEESAMHDNSFRAA